MNSCNVGLVFFSLGWGCLSNGAYPLLLSLFGSRWLIFSGTSCATLVWWWKCRLVVKLGLVEHHFYYYLLHEGVNNNNNNNNNNEPLLSLHRHSHKQTNTINQQKEVFYCKCITVNELRWTQSFVETSGRPLQLGPRAAFFLFFCLVFVWCYF